jgi:hypothetical protein
MALIVPAEIEDLIKQYDESAAPFTEMDLQQQLGEARRTIGDRSEEEDFGAWSEVLEFTLTGSRTSSSPWGIGVIF